MHLKKIDSLTPKTMLLGTAAFSLLCSAVVYVLNRAPRKVPGPTLHPVPDEPDVDKAVPSTPPTHFSEDIVIPGFTETGTQILQDDDEGTPSPGSVTA